MMRKLKLFLERRLSGFFLYQIAVGGYRFYSETRENRYKPGEFLYYGKNVRIEAGVSITAPDRFFLGDQTGISQHVRINAVGGCHMGKGCQIGEQTTILTTEHQYTGGEALPYDKIRLVKPVYLEDFVWVGARAAIAPGVRIGEGAIIGMGSVVVQDVPALAIVSGNPAQVLGYRLRSDFEKAKQEGSVIDPYEELPLLRIPPITRRKYKNELKEFGFELSSGSEFFRSLKHNPKGKRLVPAGNPASHGGCR